MSNFVDGVKSLLGISKTERVQETTQASKPSTNMNTSVMESVKTQDVREMSFSGSVSLNDISDGNNTKYTIKKGDTFSKIASNTPNVTTQMIIDANPGVDPKKLKVGQTINIPKAQSPKPAAVTYTQQVANARQKALDAQNKFQKTNADAKTELELQKTFIKEYINWAKTVLSAPQIQKSDVQDVITQITALKTYKATEVKPLQAELNALLPALRSKVGIQDTPKTTTQTTTAKTTTAKTTTPSTPTTTAKTTTAKTTTPTTPTTTAKTTTTTQTSKTHKVVAGDTYWKIANNNGISVEELKAANPGVDPAKLRVGQSIKVPAPKPVVIHSDMDVDASKRSEYKSQIEKMIKAKGITDSATIGKLSTLITNKSIEMKVDPIVISGIIGQECDYLYQSDNIWGRNGKGMTQLTYSAIEDLYRLKGANNNYVPAYYKGAAKDKLVEIFQKYPDVDSLYKAICKKENYELNLEVGIIVFKGKIEIDYSTHPERTERQHLEHSIRNYNGNTAELKSGEQVRDRYKKNIVANYDKYKVS